MEFETKETSNEEKEEKETKKRKEKEMLLSQALRAEHLARECYMKHFPTNHEIVIAAVKKVIFQWQTLQKYLVESELDMSELKRNEITITEWMSVLNGYHSNVKEALSANYKKMVLKRFPFSFILEEKPVEEGKEIEKKKEQKKEQKKEPRTNLEIKFDIQPPKQKGRLLLLKSFPSSYYLVKVGYFFTPPQKQKTKKIASVPVPVPVPPLEKELRIYSECFANTLYLWNKPGDEDETSLSLLQATVMTALTEQSEITQHFESISFRRHSQMPYLFELHYAPITIANCGKICSILNSIEVNYELDGIMEICG